MSTIEGFSPTPPRALPQPQEENTLPLFLSSQTEAPSLANRSFKILTVEPLKAALSFFAKKPKALAITPPLTGSYPVGHTSFVLQGPKNPIGVDVFAPTEHLKMMEPLEYELYPGHPLGPTDKRFCTHSYDGLCPLHERKFPVVIFSHGFGSDSNDYRPLAEEVASHGYVALVLTHPFSAAYTNFKHTVEIDELPNSHVVGKQAKDIAFVMRAAKKSLNKIGDFREVTLIGHGIGGIAALVAAGKDKSIRGCINIDGALQDNIESLETPVLTIISGHKYSDPLKSAEKADVEVMDRNWKAFHKKSPHSRLEILPEANHNDFLLESLLREGSKAAGLQTLAHTNALIIDFLASLRSR